MKNFVDNATSVQVPATSVQVSVQDENIIVLSNNIELIKSLEHAVKLRIIVLFTTTRTNR
jgi:hypothetical protein